MDSNFQFNAHIPLNGQITNRVISVIVSEGQSTRNLEISTGPDNFIKINGLSSNFKISGVEGGFEGKTITLYNSTSYNMTIANNCNLCQNSDRILTLTGNDLVSNGTGSVTMQYDGVSNVWIIISAKL